MLQDLPKKEKNYFHPTRAQLFWRVLGECWRRSVTPFVMYLFMSIIGLITQVFNQSETLQWWEIVLGTVCILCGAAFNAHLCFNYGKEHYKIYRTGEIHRRNERLGIPVGMDHRLDKEYRVWKGFVIGLLIGLPVIVFSVPAHLCRFGGAEQGESAFNMILLFFCGWAYLPFSWISRSVTYKVSQLLCMAFIVLPVAVSGAFYIVGAQRERRKQEEQDARTAALEKVREEQQRAAEERKKQQQERTQTEEQRRKTAQSKKKKK